MISYRPVDASNFDDFYNLLQQRGAAAKSFYIWKYAENPVQKFPWGFIAYDNEVPCGCMGCLSRLFIDKNGSKQYATWFADWYVRPDYRGKGIGIKLQKKIFGLSDFAFGITNPKPAQIIAAKTGYKLQDKFLLVKGKGIPEFVNQSSRLSAVKQYLKDWISYLYFKPFGKKSYTITELSSAEEIPNDLLGQPTSNVFYHDTDYYSWLFRMPTTYSRRWLLVSVNSFKILLCLEELNKTSRIKVYQHSFPISSKKDYKNFLKLLSSINRHLKAQVFETMDYVPFINNSFANKFIGRWQPFQYKMNKSLSEITNVNIADKESSWENINIKPLGK